MILLSEKLGVNLNSKQIRSLYQSNFKLSDPSLWKIGGELAFRATNPSWPLIFQKVGSDCSGLFWNKSIFSSESKFTSDLPESRMTGFEINLKSIYILLLIQVHPQFFSMEDHIVWNYVDINSLFALNSNSPPIFQNEVHIFRNYSEINLYFATNPSSPPIFQKVGSHSSDLFWNKIIFCSKSKFTSNLPEWRITYFGINLKIIYILPRIQVHPQVSIMKDHIVWNYFDINSLFALNSSSPPIFQNVGSDCSGLFWN